MGQVEWRVQTVVLQNCRIEIVMGWRSLSNLVRSCRVSCRH